jgi:hypothetical protein
MTFPLGETIELQHDTNVIRQQQRLDLAPQAPSQSATTGDLSRCRCSHARRQAFDDACGLWGRT